MEQEHSFALGVQSPSSENDGTPGVNNTQDENTKNDQNIMEVPAIAVGENYDSGILFRFWKGLYKISIIITWVVYVLRNIISPSAETVRGINDLWTTVNHIAIVVSDVGASLSFYTDVVGMKQIMRPNFDR